MEGGGDSGKKDLLKNKIAGWNDGSATKPLLRSQHQLPVSPVLGDRVPSSGLCGRLHTCSIHTDTQTKVNLETNKKRKLLLYLFSEQVQNCFGLQDQSKRSEFRLGLLNFKLFIWFLPVNSTGTYKFHEEYVQTGNKLWRINSVNQC